MKKNLHSLSHWLHARKGPLGGMLDHARQQSQLLALVRAALPETVAAHCGGAVIRGDTLILFADSAAWSTRLRFAAGDLAGHLARQAGVSIKFVKIQTLEQRLAPEIRHQRQPISARNAALLKATASSIPEVPLRDALMRLARAAGKDDQ